MSDKVEVTVTPVERTADRIMSIKDAFGIVAHFYRCNDCKAIMVGMDDARDHLRWHDTLIREKKN